MNIPLTCPEIIPAVTVPPNPKGLPINNQSPTRITSLSPKGTATNLRFGINLQNGKIRFIVFTDQRRLITSHHLKNNPNFISIFNHIRIGNNQLPCLCINHKARSQRCGWQSFTSTISIHKILKKFIKRRPSMEIPEYPASPVSLSYFVVEEIFTTTEQ